MWYCIDVCSSTTKSCDGKCPCCDCSNVPPVTACGEDGKKYTSSCEAACK